MKPSAHKLRRPDSEPFLALIPLQIFFGFKESFIFNCKSISSQKKNGGHQVLFFLKQWCKEKTVGFLDGSVIAMV